MIPAVERIAAQPDERVLVEDAAAVRDAMVADVNRMIVAVEEIGAQEIARLELANRALATFGWFVVALTLFWTREVAGRERQAARVRDVEAQSTAIRERADRELREAHDRLAEANGRLVEEHEELVQAQKLSSIGLLAAGVAHEIQNPLMGIRSAVEAIRDDRVPDDRLPVYFETVTDGLERIRRIVEDLLHFARPSTGPTEAIDLSEMVASCVRLLPPAGSPEEIHLDVRVDPGTEPVRGDRTRLVQALTNLVLNAVHAVESVEESGRVEISVTTADGRIALRVRGRRSGDPGRSPAEDLRALLHHQGRGPGHGPRPVGGPGHRPLPRGRSRDRERAGPGHHGDPLARPGGVDAMRVRRLDAPRSVHDPGLEGAVVGPDHRERDMQGMQYTRSPGRSSRLERMTTRHTGHRTSFGARESPPPVHRR